MPRALPTAHACCACPLSAGRTGVLAAGNTVPRVQHGSRTCMAERLKAA